MTIAVDTAPAGHLNYAQVASCVGNALALHPNRVGLMQKPTYTALYGLCAAISI
jgi:hypothetical protein